MDLARCDMAEAVAQAFRFSKLVLATPTYNADVFPFMKEFLHHLTERNYQNRTVAFIENGSWAPMAAKVMTKMLEGSKNLTYACLLYTSSTPTWPLTRWPPPHRWPWPTRPRCPCWTSFWASTAA